MNLQIKLANCEVGDIVQDWGEFDHQPVIKFRPPLVPRFTPEAEAVKITDVTTWTFNRIYHNDNYYYQRVA